MQAGASSAAAAVRPPVNVSPVSPVPTQRLPSPPSVPGPSTSPAVQLPQMEPSVAKEMLVQLVQQLQQAGQLPNDDMVQRLLQTNAEAGYREGTLLEVKKEVESGQQDAICVISKTESCEQKQAPEVYMDVAEDSASMASTPDNVGLEMDSNTDEGETSAGRSTRNSLRGGRRGSSRSRAVPDDDVTLRAGRQRRTPVRSDDDRSCQQEVTPPQRKTSSRTSSHSPSVDVDPKLQKKCIVKLDRTSIKLGKSVEKLDKVDTEKKPLGPTSEQLSRVDRLKNMKKYNVLSDILHISSEPGQSAAAGDFKELADYKFAPQEKIPVNQQQSAASFNRVGPKNIFSIFAQHSTGSPLQQEEPAAEVRPSDPLPQSVGVLLQRSVNAAQNKSMSLRSMYLGFASHNMEWLSLVSCTYSTGRKTFCQCSFCPKLGEYPRDVAVHISREHQDLVFALNKHKPFAGPLVYIKCRHCNFVTVESTLAWIHFDIHHGISDILDCSSRAADIDLSGPDMPPVFIDLDDIMGKTTAYVCFDCSAVNADPDTNASLMLMARHVARQHPNSINCNGNFVKLMMLTRTAGDPDSIRGSPTYRQAMCDAEHARGRREVYICMFCR